MLNIGGFDEHLAWLIDSVGAALAVFCQATLQYIRKRRTLFVAMKTRNSARFKRLLPDAKLALRKVVQPLLAKSRSWIGALSSNPCSPLAAVGPPPFPARLRKPGLMRMPISSSLLFSPFVIFLPACQPIAEKPWNAKGLRLNHEP